MGLIVACGVPVWIYFYLDEAEDLLMGYPPGRVNLPLPDLRYGSCLVILVAVGIVALAWFGTRPARERFDGQPRTKAAKAAAKAAAQKARARSLSPWQVDSEEPEDEFWSPEPIIAWRTWWWNGHTLKGVRAPWEGPELEAKCSVCEEPPGWDCTCGIYAVKSTPRGHVVERKGEAVWGRVELSGLVIEHEDGYRASHVRILELWTDGGADMREDLTLKYGVPVHGQYDDPSERRR
jgi:hypothetical protein